MATTRRGEAPNQEWVLMYRGGLSRTRIAELVGAAAPTVCYHLRRFASPFVCDGRCGDAAGRRRCR